MSADALARDRESVASILNAADKLAELVAAGREAFDSSWVPQAAARWEVQVIGEAAGRLSDEFRAEYPQIRARAAKRMRNVFVHQYDVVDSDEVWETLTTAVPEFASSLRALPGLGPADEERYRSRRRR